MCLIWDDFTEEHVLGDKNTIIQHQNLLVTCCHSCWQPQQLVTEAFDDFRFWACV